MPPLAPTVTIELPPLHRIGVLDEAGHYRARLGDIPRRRIGAAMCIGYRVRVSPRRNAERASAEVRPGAASSRLTVTIELPPLHRIGVLDELATTALGWVMFPSWYRCSYWHRSPCTSKSPQER